MLQYLKIRNLALVEEVELDFAPGFTAVTGETGAGKSVLLGALGLLSGERGDKTLIAEGAGELEVEAGLYFADSVAVDALLKSLELPSCEDGVLLLRRTLARSKISRIQVNGRSTTAASLRLIGDGWIDFHGPGEPQKLFKEATQLEMLDLFAGAEMAAKDYRAGFQKWRETHREIERVSSETRLNEDELAFIRAQIEQIESAVESIESINELETEYGRASNAQDLTQMLETIQEAMIGEQGAVFSLGEVEESARKLAAMEASGGPLAERLQGLLLELQDLAEEYAGIARTLDLDEAAVEELEARMNRWLEVRRKHGGSVEAVLERRRVLAEKIAVQGDVEGALEQLRSVAEEQEGRLWKQAEAWTQQRKKAAATLGSEAGKLLLALGFRKAGLQIEVVETDGLKEYGNSACRILFAPNPGRPPLPLNQIASSGEMARVMLALKAVMAKIDATPVLVFDEVDANVGGEIGGNVGAELARLGTAHQVICVTHLPQVAARAQQHYLIEKTQDDSSTKVSMTTIHGSDMRLDELARMLGDRGAKSAREHAAALLAKDNLH